MPKVKTHSGAKKRFRVKKNGEVKKRRAFRNHILEKVSTKAKRHLRKSRLILAKVDAKKIKELLGVA